jgi:hypothetical protein
VKIIAALLFLAGLVAFADEPKNLLKPTNKVESWRFEEHEGGKGTMKAADDAIVFHVTKVTGTDWHVQAVQTGLDLKEGQQYTLKFKGKSEAGCTVGLSAQIDEEDWHQIGLGEQIYLGKTYQEHTFTFRAEGVNTKQKNRFGFVLGHEAGTVSIKELTLVVK